MRRWRLSWEARQAARRFAGAGLMVAGLTLLLRHLPLWLWAVAAGVATTWLGAQFLRDR